MPRGPQLSFSTADLITLGLGALLVVLLSLMGYRAWKKSRVSPEERERRRRLWLVVQGKMGDATVLDLRENHLFYSYAVRGVEYTASQDVTALNGYLPADLTALVGPISVKYDARNPANSIVLAEEWSGLRVNAGRPSR